MTQEPAIHDTPANTAQRVRAVLTELIIASARDVAGELDISISTARRHLEALVTSGAATVRSGTGYSDMGRQTNVNEYCWTADSGLAPTT